MEEIAGCLARGYLFQDLSEAELDLVSRAGRLEQYEDGQAVVREREPADRLLLVCEGIVDIYKKRGSRETYLFSIGPGGHFGEAVLGFGGEGPGRTATARATGAVRLVGLPREGLLALMEEHPGIAARVLRRIVTSLLERLQNASRALVLP